MGLKKQIDNLEGKLFSQESEYNADDAKQLMDLYIRFADSLPSDSLTPEYLFKAADISMYVSDGMTTIRLLDRIMNNYSMHEKASVSLFLKAFIFDTKLNDTASAHVYYNQYIENYPDKEFNEDARNAIRNLGKTPEQLIDEFEKMNAGIE